MKTEIVYKVCNKNKLIILDLTEIHGKNINIWIDIYLDSKNKSTYDVISDVIKKIHKLHPNYLFYDTSYRNEVLFKKTKGFLYWDFFIKLFKYLGIKNKFYFISNNTGESDIPKMGYDNYIGMPSMIGWTYPHGYNVTFRKFKKKFISLNRRDAPHRRIIFDYLNENYKNDSYLSFTPNEVDNPRRTILEDLKVTKPFTPTSSWTNKFQKDSFCNIVTESRIDLKTIHITEKTDKCFSAGQPFVLVSGPHYLKKLHELGFKTFDKWWDESYDGEEDFEKRISKIKEVIKHIGSWNLKKCESVYEEMLETLIFNKERQKEYYYNGFFNELLVHHKITEDLNINLF